MILFSLQCYADKKTVKAPVVKKESKWEKLNRMITKEENFIKTINNRGPRLQWRLLELKTERLKLIKEKENNKFLNASFKLRKKHKKDWFFKESRSYEKEIRRKGLKIIKSWPRYKYNADIYYTLGLNSRDFNKGKQTEYFFKQALKKAERGSQVVYLASVGLAEYYYNEKKYIRAVRYYRSVIKNSEDEWHSKHIYNLSWCFLKTGKYQEAILYGEKAHALSKQEDYIDVSEQVYDSIGLFYVMGKREKDGAEFYKKNVQVPAKYIIKMSKKMANEGEYKKADYLLKTALDHSIDKSQVEEEIKIRLAYLDFYRNFKKFNQFFTMSKAIESIYIKKPFEGELHDQSVEKIEGLVGYLQVRLTRNSKIKVENYSKPLLKRILDYFDILAVINKKKTDFYRFYQGETLFAVNEINRSFFQYQKSLEFNKKVDLKKNDPEQKHTLLRKKLMNSLLACLEEKKFEDKHLIYTYQNHIDLYPINPISQKLYSKLFNIHMKRKDPPKAVTAMEVYNKNYPSDLKIQQAMLIKLIDFYILGKNTDKLAYWINKLQKGYFSFDQNYIKQATNVLGEILFHDFTKLAASGKHEESIAGNKMLFEDKKYPKIIHAQAATKIALSYLHLKKSTESLNWTIAAIPLFKAPELKKRLPQIKASIDRFVILQDLKHALKLSNYLYKHFCHKNEPLKGYLYDQIVTLNLLEEKYKSAYRFINNDAKKCDIGKVKYEETMISYINYTFLHGKTDLTFQLFKKFALKEKKYKDLLSSQVMEIFWREYAEDSKSKLTRKSFSYLKKYASSYPSDKISKSINKVDEFNKFKNKYKKKHFKAFNFGQKFDEQKYNNELTQKFEKLKKWVEETSPFTSNAPYPVVLATLKLIHQKHQQLAKVIRDVSPPGMEGEYLKSFKQAMNGIASNVQSSGDDYFNQGLKLRLNSYEQAIDNKYYLSTSETFKKIKINYPAIRYSLSFDRTVGKRSPATISRNK
jgi:Tfp pilus assembly protein PilF